MKNFKNFLQLSLLFICSFALTETAHAQLDYATAIGLRIGYFGNFGITGKKALASGDAAIEGIIYADFNTGSNSFQLTGLYEKYYDINSVDGLDWYWAGGAYVGFLSFDIGFAGDRETSTFIGLTGGVGLEYKFNGTPIAISTDWLPGINLTGGGGFSGRGGSVAIRYTME